MSSTLGTPGFTPSNLTGGTGISQGQVGRLGSGILQTIEEGAGALSSELFYYDKSVGYYQIPSVMRSHGDDPKSFNVLNFQARSTITLPRKFFNFGPSYLRFQLPIDYAWSGCEYVANFCEMTTPIECTSFSGLGDLGTPPDLQDVGDILEVAPRPFNHPYIANGNKGFYESSGCSTMLPTSFQSGGMAFAFPSQIELNMGGAGQLTFDRYSNWAAIMASAPFYALRKDLMRWAGGGLNLNDPIEAKQAPVKWGRVEWKNAAGNSNGTVFYSSYGEDGTALGGLPVADTQSIGYRVVPTHWDVLLPIKTPDTNFMYSLARRKPLDTSCFAGDFQMTFSWSNFYEWSDTGKGYPNAPIYSAVRYAGQGILANIGFGYTWPIVGIAPAMYADNEAINGNAAAPPPFVYELASPVLQNCTAMPAPKILNATTVLTTKDQVRYIGNCIITNPVVWTNHCRVASGAPLLPDIHYNQVAPDLVQWSTAIGTPLQPQPPVGRPRLPQYVLKAGLKNQALRTFTSLQSPADVVNANVQYPEKFTSVTFLNSSLKLTNPALGAYNALRVDKEAVLYYPFQYFFSQIFRITTNPWKQLNHWSAFNLNPNNGTFGPLLQDIHGDRCKITQLIQMPANPCTAMLISIFREKDRQVIPKNKMNSYSPVLFWNALNPLRAVLKDGGNILFEYANAIDYEFYSVMDRPDALKIPFRGGHVKVQPQNCHGNRYSAHASGNFGANRIYIDHPNLNSDFIPGYYPGLTTNQKVKPYWSYSQPADDEMFVGAGYNGNSTPATSRNSYAADDLCNSLALGASGKKFEPCHTTEWFEATILEFCFAMNEPMAHEKIVQEVPSFAKTQLQFDFWIDPKLKADNGMDDMYDTTYGTTRAAANALGAPGVDGNALMLTSEMASYPGPFSHPVPHCYHEYAEPESLELRFRDLIGSQPTGTGITSAATFESLYLDGFSFRDQCKSWNINNGDLMLHVAFVQNQVWTLSPLRTSFLSARG